MKSQGGGGVRGFDGDIEEVNDIYSMILRLCVCACTPICLFCLPAGLPDVHPGCAQRYTPLCKTLCIVPWPTILCMLCSGALFSYLSMQDALRRAMADNPELAKEFEGKLEQKVCDCVCVCVCVAVCV